MGFSIAVYYTRFVYSASVAFWKKFFFNNLKWIIVMNENFGRMHNSIVVHVCAINFFYVFIVPGPILRHLGEFGKIRLLLGENTRFLPEGGQYGYLEDGLWPIFNFFFFLCRIWLHLILAWSRSMKLSISGDIWILSDFRHYT